MDSVNEKYLWNTSLYQPLLMYGRNRSHSCTYSSLSKIQQNPTEIDVHTSHCIALWVICCMCNFQLTQFALEQMDIDSIDGSASADLGAQVNVGSAEKPINSHWWTDSSNTLLQMICRWSIIRNMQSFIRSKMKWSSHDKKIERGTLELCHQYQIHLAVLYL